MRSRSGKAQCAVWLAMAAIAWPVVAAAASAASADSTYGPDWVLYPAAPCTQDTVTLFVRGYVATPCDSFISAEKVDDHTVRVRTQVYSTRQCFAAPFQFFSVPVVMGRFPAGANEIRIIRETIARDEIGTRDTTRVTIPLAFDVTSTCTQPPPVPADKLPYVISVATNPSPPCADRPTTVHLAGVFRDGCGQVVSVDPTTLSLVIAPYAPVTTPCTLALEPWSADFPLGLLAAGHHRVAIRMTVLGADDWWPPIPTRSYVGVFDFDVPFDCGQPERLPYVDFIRVQPQRPCGGDGPICPGESLEVLIGGTFPSNCFSVVSVETFDPPYGSPLPYPPIVRLTISDEGCSRRACTVGPISWSHSLTLAPLPARDYQLVVEETRWLGCPPVQDSHATTEPFTVVPPESCARPTCDCLFPGWLGSGSGECAAFIKPGGTASVLLGIRSPVALAGLEGTIYATGGSFKIAKIEAVGAAAGMQLSWTTTAEGNARFVMFATQGAPIPATPPIAPASVPVLRVTVALAPSSRQRIALSTGWDLLGSDANGHAVPMCLPDPRELAFRIPPTALICVEQGECDFNADGAVDVRDLVLMVHCVVGQGSCPTDAGSRFDCDGNGAFDLGDVICCAMQVIRGPGCPGCPVDSVRAAPEVTVGFGSPRAIEGGLEVPLHIEGAGSLGGARIRLHFPADRFVVTGADGDATWIQLHEASGNELSLGLIHGGALTGAFAPEGPLDVKLRLALKSGMSVGGEMTVFEADFSGRDGVKLAVDLGAPRVDLGGGGGVSLSPARPNPFEGSTRFSVQLDRPGTLDVGVYDLAGRRIASLFHGPASAGVHPYVWDGRSEDGSAVRGGVYFYRAVANGKSVTRRMVMLGGR